MGFLVDTGANHNFIDPSTMSSMGLKMNDSRGFTVEVADGERMKGGECCMNTKIHIPGFDSQIDLLVVPLGDTLIILGTMGLKSLGPALWDFENIELLERGSGCYIEGS